MQEFGLTNVVNNAKSGKNSVPSQNRHGVIFDENFIWEGDFDTEKLILD